MAPPKSSSTGCGGCSITGWMKFLAIALVIFTPLVSLAERYHDSFCIFDDKELHELAQRAIAAHPEDTKAIVDFIVSDLHEKHPKNVNLHQEWIFNNAGGAMGAMYVIHASMYPPFSSFPLFLFPSAHSSR